MSSAEGEAEAGSRAPMGTQLGVLAAGVHWVSALFLVAGFLSSEPGHEGMWKEKYPDRADWRRVLTNFSHPDCAPMMQDRMVGLRDFQRWLVFEGIFESIACLLAVCTVLCLKAHMNYKRPADEKELVMYMCMIFGLTIPMLEFCMRAGPVSYVAWVGSESAKEDGMWTGFSPTHVQTLMMTLTVVESLFTWLNVFADLLLGVGFVLIATLGSSRAAVIIDNKTKLVAAWAGAMLLLAFFSGLLQALSEESTRLAQGVSAGLNTVVALFLMPTFFVLLAIGLGRVSSIQTLNNDLSEAVAEVGENTADDYKGTDQATVEAVEAASSNSMLSSADD
jgi:hypothetical protein